MNADIHQKIHDHIISVHAPDLEGESIPGDYDLLATGVVDSLALLELVEWIQSTFGVSTLESDISPTDLSTIYSITEFVQSNATVKS